MTKKDYVLIAKIISEEPNNKKRAVLCTKFTFELSADNEKFDKAKFRKACNVKPLKSES